MKIKKLGVQNFRNHEATELELDQVNFFVGHNNAGKTTLLAALEWALTGHCLWTDRAGRGSAELICRGQKQAAVSLEVEGVGSILRSMPPNSLRVGKLTGQEAQASILNSLRTDEERLQIALNASAFLAMPPSEQRAFLFGAFGLACNAETVTEKLAAWLKTAGHSEEKATALAGQAKGYYPANLTGGPEVLEVMEKRAKDLRKELKRDKQRAEAALAELSEGALLETPVDEQVEELKSQLAQLRQHREELLSAAGDRNLPARRQALSNKISILDQKLQTVQDKAAGLMAGLQGLPVQENALDEGSYSQREKDIRGAIESLNNQVASLKGEAANLQNRMETVTSAAKALASEDRRCPLAPEHIQCGMSKTQVEEILQRLNQEYRAAQESSKDLQGQVAGLLAEINQAGEELAQLKENQAVEREQTKQRLLLQGELNTQQILVKQLTSEREALAQELASLPEPEAAPEGLELELQALVEEMQEVEGKLVQAGERLALTRRQEELKGEVTTLTAEVANMEILVKALGPDGLRQELLAGILGDFLGRVNDRLGRLTGGAYQLGLGKDMTLLCRANGGPLLPLKLLSKSEQLRVGIAIQEALSHAVGLSFLAIDEADMLDQENRDLLTGMLLDIAEEYDQVLVFTTVGDVKPENPGLAGVKLFWVEEGKVSEV